MTLHPLAGKPAPANVLIDVVRLEREYFECQPDLSDPRKGEQIEFFIAGNRNADRFGKFAK